MCRLETRLPTAFCAKQNPFLCRRPLSMLHQHAGNIFVARVHGGLKRTAPAMPCRFPVGASRQQKLDDGKTATERRRLQWRAVEAASDLHVGAMVEETPDGLGVALGRCLDQDGANVRVGALLEQQFDRVGLVAGQRGAKRAAPAVAGQIDVRALCNEQLDHGGVTGEGGSLEGGAMEQSGRVGVDIEF
jgi:hypothetical protein